MNISLFDDLGGLFLHFSWLLLLGLHGRSSEVECNPKMSISFFEDLGGLLSHFSWLLLLSRSSEVECNKKNEHFIFWLLRGLFSHFSQLLSLRSLGWSSEVECNPKPSILFFDDIGHLLSLFLHFGQLSMLRMLGRSSEVECNPKMGILFFDDIGGLFSFFFCILVDVCHWDHLANQQKLNVIQKQTFYFSMTLGPFFIFLHFGWCSSLRSPSQSSEVEHNPKMNILFFDDIGGLFHCFAFWSTFVTQIAQPISRSWT